MSDNTLILCLYHNFVMIKLIIMLIFLVYVVLDNSLGIMLIIFFIKGNSSLEKNYGLDDTYEATDYDSKSVSFHV